VSQMSI
jgi:hypothetical protein